MLVGSSNIVSPGALTVRFEMLEPPDHAQLICIAENNMVHDLRRHRFRHHPNLYPGPR